MGADSKIYLLFSYLALIFLKNVSPKKARKYLQQKVASRLHPDVRREKNVYVDVSVIYKKDAGTGIQRVVKSIISELVKYQDDYLKIFTIYADGSKFAYAKSGFLGTNKGKQTGARVTPQKGEIFLGLDLSLRQITRNQFEVLKWKLLGVKFCFVLYDLLPITNPEWFSKQNVKYYKKWFLNTYIYSDIFLCTSKTVEDKLELLVRQLWDVDVGDYKKASIKLGADFLKNDNSIHQPNDKYIALLNKIKYKRYILMVGTIEPRKSYDEAVLSFENFYVQNKQCDISLLIVGKTGWKTKTTQNTLLSYNTSSKPIFWIADADDELLRLLYERCFGLFTTSKDEGFGLPLAEAASLGKPILARDIPIFREFKYRRLTYYSKSDPENLSNSIGQWIADVEASDHCNNVLYEELTTWKNTSINLIDILKNKI